ncbi:hypothetical protein GGR58DRAFT_87451 [Xylaria digitata]|nr:hypothetical protein GGR58DRAFT_87451 [Xylaria digitata]
MSQFEAKEGQEIFDCARCCKELFQQLQSTLAGHDGIGTHFRTVRDYFQRFELWAGFIGVFADNAPLDYRLRFYPEVRDLVLRMLKLLERNLSHSFWFDSPNTKDMNQSVPAAVSSDTSTTLAASAALDAIQEAIERLHRLAVLIRKSPSSSLTSRVNDFTLKADPAKVEEFHRVASLFVMGLLPRIDGNLATQLVSSISLRRLRILYEGKHKENIKARRIQVVVEPSQLEAKITGQEGGLALAEEDISGSGALHTKKVPAKLHQSHAHSDAASSGFHIEESRRYDGGPTDVSETSTLTSVAQGYAYPRQPKPDKGNQYHTCDWCSTEINVFDLTRPG